ncbi:DUF1273 domain-containing protein [Streptococcus ovis]|uniref:DUF1273 domain-containing protein n=1 Tax=Streptococcus ovis TaxID=82806 RepID=UPI00037604C9|nr:DUF1273 domain-containing protein [Streptococcus ovis]
MKSVLVAGYKQHDLGIFSDKDPKIQIIKEAIRRDCTRMLENGVEWFIFTGNLGFEYWTLEVVEELRTKGFAIQTATIFPFATHGENWNEGNQQKLALFQQADFVKSAYPRYENPSQFRDFNQFLLENTDGAYLFYDTENETNLKYLYQMISQKEEYPVQVLHFDDLNDLAENFTRNR